MVEIHSSVYIKKYRKYLKEKQISICVTPGLCLTSMTEDFDEKIKAKAHSAESGALKIH